jgi:hypothetical protein
MVVPIMDFFFTSLPAKMVPLASSSAGVSEAFAGETEISPEE